MALPEWVQEELAQRANQEKYDNQAQRGTSEPIAPPSEPYVPKK